MDKRLAATLRTFTNDQAMDRDTFTEEGRDDVRLLNDQELWLASGGEDIPTW